MPSAVRSGRFEQYRGAEFNFYVDGTDDAGDPIDWTSTPVTLVLTDPTATTVITLRYLNSGTDGVLETGSTPVPYARVRFRKDATWTTANLTVGEWEMVLAAGLKATTQKPLYRATLYVRDARSAPLPTS